MLEFFNDNFGRYLVEQTDDPVANARRALSSGHRMHKGGRPQRIASGWAIVRPGALHHAVRTGSRRHRLQQADPLRGLSCGTGSWDGTPRMFLEFAKRPVPVANLFRTFDLRQVRICSPTGVETFDFTKAPEKDGCKTHKVLWKLKKGDK